MPLYEYKCPECGEELTVLQKLNDPAPLCSCKDELITMKRLMSLGSFRLKGSCWARDGYSKEKK